MDCTKLKQMFKDLCKDDFHTSTYVSEPMHMLIGEIRCFNCLYLHDNIQRYCKQTLLRRTTSSLEQRACGTYSTGK